MSSYSLFNKTIDYSNAEENGLDLYNDLVINFNSLFKSFYKWYNDCENIEAVLNNYENFALLTLKKYALGSLFATLTDFEIYYYTEKSYIKKCFVTSYIYESLSDVKDDYNVIIDEQNEKKQQRQQRKQNRSKMSIEYSFNIASTIDRALQACVVNIATGLAHDVVNTAGNIASAISASKSKASLYQNEETKKRLLDGIKNSISSTFAKHIELVNEKKINVCFSFDSEKSTALFENAKRLPDKREILLFEAIKEYPFNISAITYIFDNYEQDQKNIWIISERFSVDLASHIEETFANKYTEEVKNNSDKVAQLRAEIVQTMEEFNLESSATLTQLDTDELSKIAKDYYSKEFLGIEQINEALKSFRLYSADDEIKKKIILKSGVWELSNEYNVKFELSDIETTLSRYFNNNTNCSEEQSKIVKIKMKEVMNHFNITESSTFNAFEKHCLQNLCIDLNNLTEQQCYRLKEKIQNYDALEINKIDALNLVQKRIEEIWAKEDGEIFDNVYMNTNIYNIEDINRSIRFIQDNARTSNKDVYLTALKSCTPKHFSKAISYQLQNTKAIMIIGIITSVIGAILGIAVFPAFWCMSIIGISLLVRYFILKHSWDLLTINGKKLHFLINIKENRNINTGDLNTENILYIAGSIILCLIIAFVGLKLYSVKPEKDYIETNNQTTQATDIPLEPTEIKPTEIKPTEVKPTEIYGDTKTYTDKTEGIDVDDSVAVTVNPDGSFNVEFIEAPCSLTLPSTWNNNFVIRHNIIYAKKAFYNDDIPDNDGALMYFEFTDEETNPAPSVNLGKAGTKTCFYIRVTDIRYNMDNSEEKAQYQMMKKDIQEVVNSVVCIPEKQNKSSSSQSKQPTDLSDYLYGQISSNGQEIEGYTSDYVVNGGKKTRQWLCEDKWHITAKRYTNSYGITWYECWDTDDGDYYGWIDSSYISFYDSTKNSLSVSDYVGSWREVSKIRVSVEIQKMDSSTIKISIIGSGGAAIAYKEDLTGTLNSDGTISFSGVSYTEVYTDNEHSEIQDYDGNRTGTLSIGRTGLLSISVDGSDDYKDYFFTKN